MLTISVIRNFHFDSMEKSILSIGDLLKLIPTADLSAYRDGGVGWTVTQVLCHLRDFEAVFMERATLTVEQNFPDLPFPNPDQLANERHYNSQDPHAAYAEWVELRKKFLHYLQTLPDEVWEREANHPTRGRVSLNDQLLLSAWHNMNHMEQITRILAEKKAG